jgi:2,5-diketo-D-gluconate reductase B
MDQAVSILGEGTILTNQVEVHPFLANRKVVEHAQSLGMTVTGYMPLAVGKVMDDETLIGIAEARNVTPAQIALAWVASRDVVVIPSSTRATHQKANLEALNIKLSADEIARIDKLDRNERIANPGFAPAWD